MVSETGIVDGSERPSGLRLVAPAEPAGVPQLRQQLTSWVRELGVDDETLGAIRLAVTEAVTNAVVHAFVGREPGTVTVEARPGPDVLVVRVADDGRGLGPRADSPGLGMGLPLIGRLCAHVDLSAGPDGSGSEVRMTFTAPGLDGPAASYDDETVDEILALLDRVGTQTAFGGLDVGSLVGLLVPRLADVCSIALLDADGGGRRVGARVARADGTIDEAASQWVLDFPLTAPRSPSLVAASSGHAHVVEIDEAWIASVTTTPQMARELRALGLRWWAAVPLHSGGVPVGALALAGRGDGAQAAVAAATRIAEQASGLVATARLVDDLQRSRRRFERILATLSEAVTVTEPSGRIVYANDAAVRLLGAHDLDEVLRANPGELAARFRITDADGHTVQPETLPYQRVLDGAEAEPILTRSVHLESGRAYWLRSSSTLLDDDGPLAVTVIQDVTAQTEAERRTRFLAELGEALGSTLELEETLRHIARLTVPTLADWCTIDLLADDGTVERVALHHSDQERVALGAQLHERHPTDLASDQGVALVLREGTPAHFEAITEDMILEGARDEDHARELLSFGLRSAALLPMTARGRTLGVLTLLTAESGRTLGTDDVAFATDVARRAAMAVDNARLFAAASRER